MTTLDDRLSAAVSEIKEVTDRAPLPMPGAAETRHSRVRVPALVVAGVAAALVLLIVGIPILLLAGGDSTIVDEPTATVVSTTLPPTTVPPVTVPAPSAAPVEVVPFPASDLAVLEVPLSEAVPGFTDTIVMLMPPGGGSGVMRWRSSEPMTELLLSPEQTGDGWTIGLDASAHWIGQVVDADVLTVQTVPTVPGEPSRREIVGRDVQAEAMNQAVWHDTEPGRLAWLECPNFLDGPTTLVTLNTSDPSADPIRLRSFVQGCAGSPWGRDESDAKPAVTLERWSSTGIWVSKWVAGFGGFVVESVLVDADGAEIAMVSDARMIATSPNGTSIWWSEGSQGEHTHFVLSPDGQQRSSVPGLADEEFLFHAWWSPDGTRLALLLDKHGGLAPGEEVLRTVDSVSGEVITELDLDPQGDGAAWSADNRFLVYAPDDGTSVGPATLVFHDTATNATTLIPIAEDLWDMRVR